jgi:hypothetical protein
MQHEQEDAQVPDEIISALILQEIEDMQRNNASLQGSMTTTTYSTLTPTIQQQPRYTPSPPRSTPNSHRPSPQPKETKGDNNLIFIETQPNDEHVQRALANAPPPHKKKSQNYDPYCQHFSFK